MPPNAKVQAALPWHHRNHSRHRIHHLTKLSPFSQERPAQARLCQCLACFTQGRRETEHMETEPVETRELNFRASRQQQDQQDQQA